MPSGKPAQYPSPLLKASPHSPRSAHRLGTHGFAIVLVGLVLAVATFSPPAVAIQTMATSTEEPPRAIEPDPTPTEVVLNMGQLASPAPEAVAVVPTPKEPPTQGADQRSATVTFDPRVGLPRWLRALRDTRLWSSADSAATSSGSVP